MKVGERLAGLDRRVLGAPRAFPQHLVRPALMCALVYQMVGVVLLVAAGWSDNPRPLLFGATPPFMGATAVLVRVLIEMSRHAEPQPPA